MRKPFRFITLCVAVLTASPSIAAADDLKIAQLEQDVRELKQVVSQQNRRIESLESELGRRSSSPATMPRSAPKAPESPQLWLNSANWDRVRPGMSELEAIQILGAPATARPQQAGNSRVLYYAMEMGAGSFLSGQVTLEGGKVVSVQKPELK